MYPKPYSIWAYIIRVILGEYWGYIGRMENKMDTTKIPKESVTLGFSRSLWQIAALALSR